MTDEFRRALKTASTNAWQVTFDWGGFAAAMGSNVSFQSRNVLSKKFMGQIKVRFVAAPPPPPPAHIRTPTPLNWLACSSDGDG